jgi:hypothetical protein
MANYIEEAGAILGTTSGRFINIQGTDSPTALGILKLVQIPWGHSKE